MKEACSKVLAAAKDYWTNSPDRRTILYRWLEEHLEVCQKCSSGVQDIAEELLDKRRQQSDSTSIEDAARMPLSSIIEEYKKYGLKFPEEGQKDSA